MTRPVPCIEDENLANVETFASGSSDSSMPIADETIRGMARELREWRATQPVDKQELVASQVAAMHAITGNVRGSLASYVEAAAHPEIQKRLTDDPVSELRGAFELVVRRANAVIESAALAALDTQPAPATQCEHAFSKFDPIGGPLDGKEICSKCGTSKPEEPS